MNPHEEAVVRLLADPTNRSVLSSLNEAGRHLSVRELAGHIRSTDTKSLPSVEGDPDSENRVEVLDRLCLRLHHDHLPRLSEAGLIEYDAEKREVIYGDYSEFDPEWKEIWRADELLSRVRTGPDNETDIGLLEGREEVYDYSRELADRATEELFVIYASDDLLDEGCLSHARDAIERGVELYAGAKSRGAREFFRQQLPEATVWEPQVDWMYERSTYPKISRMIFADRERVAVGLWLEETDGSKREVAMIGEGVANPLIVLVRELLGSRLDHLDYQSDDLLNRLPFDS